MPFILSGARLCLVENVLLLMDASEVLSLAFAPANVIKIARQHPLDKIIHAEQETPL